MEWTLMDTSDKCEKSLYNGHELMVAKTDASRTGWTVQRVSNVNVQLSNASEWPKTGWLKAAICAIISRKIKHFAQFPSPFGDFA
jgi:hypothetical protein